MSDKESIICYAIPGLGATAELFSTIELPDWIHLKTIVWEKFDSGESLPAYAERLLSQVDASQRHIYLGVSFGSAVAVEMARLTQPLLTVIVSGVKRAKEIPPCLRYLNRCGLHRLTPLMPGLNKPLLRKGLGVAFSTKDKSVQSMLIEMMHQVAPSFYDHALNAFLTWDNAEPPASVLHIHGTNDRLIPARNVKADMLIEDEGHMLIYTHGQEIGRLITDAVLHQNQLV